MYVNNVFDQPTSVANHRHSAVQGAAHATGDLEASWVESGTGINLGGDPELQEMISNGE